MKKKKIKKDMSAGVFGALFTLQNRIIGVGRKNFFCNPIA
jgi:hypothetical protein